MSKTISSPQLGMVDNFGRKPGTAPSKEHCFGADHGGKTCSERQTCAIHQRQLSDPVGGAMRLPRVGGNPCRYRVLVVT